MSFKNFKSKDKIDKVGNDNKSLQQIFTWFSFQPITFPMNQTRDRIVDELLRTEQLYLKNIITMIKVFKDSLALREKKLGFPAHTAAILFGNAEELVAVNQVLLDDLALKLGKWSDTQTIGDVLERMTPFFRLYIVYAVNLEKAMALFEDLKEKKDFREWMDECCANLTGNGTAGLTLNAFIIMPIQRILRYKLLLEDFIKNTETTHPDYEKLKKAYSVLIEVANQVNAAAKQQEEIDNMLKVAKKFQDYKELGLIQPGRKFIMEGVMYKVCRKENKKRRFFLFSDLFLYALISLKGGGDKFEVLNQFPIVEIVSVKDLPDQNEKGLKNLLQIVCAAKSFNVIIETAEEKEKWFKELTKAIATVHSKSKTMKIEGEQVGEGLGAAVWISDNEVKACMVCSIKFTMINRRHHCRQCGAVVCGACTTHKKELPKLGKQRVCDNCFNMHETPSGYVGHGDEPKDTSHSASHSSVTTHADEISDATEEECPLYELSVLFDYNPIQQINSDSKKLTLRKGERVTIYQTNPNGWWLGDCNGRLGWVPATFLEQPKEYMQA